LTLPASRFIRPEEGVEREQGIKKHYVETNREPIKPAKNRSETHHQKSWSAKQKQHKRKDNQSALINPQRIKGY